MVKNIEVKPLASSKSRKSVRSSDDTDAASRPRLLAPCTDIDRTAAGPVHTKAKILQFDDQITLITYLSSSMSESLVHDKPITGRSEPLGWKCFQHYSPR